MILFKNEREAKERSLGSGYNFKEKQDKIGNFSTSRLLSGSVSAKLSCLFCEGNNHSSNRCTKVYCTKYIGGSVYFKRVFIIFVWVQKIERWTVRLIAYVKNVTNVICHLSKGFKKPPLGNNQQQPIVPNTPVINPADPNLFQNGQVPVSGQQVNTESNYWITFYCKLQKRLF